ncbi:hypothetical protein WN51_10777 [Melipona quadrifasciata]|uniref:Uncharacterized protein n=1 Tax=Melipona quadrifasciata TaxID=166423 RepID=A0A0N0U6G3_9HYME|nr:hypothetical protein WN51_10777 [Melipona quadrifasciata]
MVNFIAILSLKVILLGITQKIRPLQVTKMHRNYTHVTVLNIQRKEGNAHLNVMFDTDFTTISYKKKLQINYQVSEYSIQRAIIEYIGVISEVFSEKADNFGRDTITASSARVSKYSWMVIVTRSCWSKVQTCPDTRVTLTNENARTLVAKISFIGDIKETYHQMTFLLLLIEIWSFQNAQARKHKSNYNVNKTYIANYTVEIELCLDSRLMFTISKTAKLRQHKLFLDFNKPFRSFEKRLEQLVLPLGYEYKYINSIYEYRLKITLPIINGTIYSAKICMKKARGFGINDGNLPLLLGGSFLKRFV